MSNEAVESWRLTLAVPAEAVGLFGLALETLGGALSNTAEPDESGNVAFECYLQAEPDAEAIDQLLAEAATAAGCSPPRPIVEPLAARDWVVESQRAHPPLRTDRLWIHGSHDGGVPPAGLMSLLVEASLAFGTGRHETTLGCLLAIEALAKYCRPRRVLDMGCGSGILALAAARLWPAARVLGIDNDPDAIAVARRHARLNRLTGRVGFLCAEGYRAEALRGRKPFDLVLANILARPLAVMAPALKRSLAPGGTAILSGLLVAQEKQVLAPHEALGLRLVRRRRLADWSVLSVRSPNRKQSSA